MRPKFSTDVLAEHITQTEYDDFAEENIDQAKLCILDSVGCAIGGLRTSVGRALLSFMNETDNLCGGHLGIFGTGFSTSYPVAAFVNSELANAMDFDDTCCGHPGAVVIPSSLVLAEMLHVSGKELLTSILLGYEAAIRVGESIKAPVQHHRKVMGHTWMVFGSAAVAAKLLGLNTEATANALGVAGASAPIPSDAKCSFNLLNKAIGMGMVKNNYGICSENGIRAAYLAKAGYVGPPNMLEGDTGFSRMSGADGFDPKTITKELGKERKIMQVEFKPYSCCRGSHPAIDAALDIIHKYQMRPDDVTKITVRTFTSQAEPPKDEQAPKTMGSAIYSVPYPIAVSIMGIPPGPEWFKPEIMNDASILKLAKKVRLVGDPELDKKRTGGYYAEVEIRSKDKRILKTAVAHPKGSPANPMTKEELITKFKSLVLSLMTDTKATKIVDAVFHMDEAPDASHLVKLLSK